jgi:hypothetical protein
VPLSRAPHREEKKESKRSYALHRAGPLLLAPSMTEKLLYTRSLLNHGDKNG